MKLTYRIRTGLLLGAAGVALAACDGGGSIESTGVVAPIVVNPGGGSGGGAGNADGVLDFTAAGCPAGAPEGTVESNGVQITACIIPTDAPLTEDLDLVAGNSYAFSGTLFVGENQIANASGASATLSVDPGVVVFGLSGEDAIVINPGSDIDAVGTQFDPIVFTSASDIVDADRAGGDLTAMEAASDGLVGGSANARGEWGGIVINGFAPINDCEAADLGTASCTKDGEGGSGLFGGTDPQDNSGVMRYVRVQYPGFLFSTDDELNGIAFQGVGSGTTLSNIHVHNSADDAYEWFGGTVDAKYLIATGAGDDSIDWTDGWQGTVQFAVVVQTTTLSGDPRGMEGDSNGDFPDRDPRSTPTIANFTLLSSGVDTGDDGMKIRRGTAGIFANGIVSGFNGNSVDFDADSTAATPEFLSIYVAGSADAATDGDATPIFDADSNNTRGSTELSSVFSINATRSINSADLTAVDGVQQVPYIGAFSDSVQSFEGSWMFGWALELDAFTGEEASSDCPTGTVVSINTDVSQLKSGLGAVANVCTIVSPVQGDVALTAGNVYELDGTVFVGEDAGADPTNPVPGAISGTLTVPAGTTIFGLNGEDALVVSRGSRLVVQGQEAEPVVMTSRQDVVGGTTGSGQWGGLVINGRAPINDCEAADLGTVACEKEGEGGSGLFGGQTANDDSGVLNYLRVQYAGFLFSTDDELNGIAFQGVGSGTDVDYVQVHQNADDGVEFFGGTVNVKHVVITESGDDSFDWTDGWTGDAQFVILRELNGISGDPRGIEADSNGDFPNRDPRSAPTIANLTLLADADGQDGVRLRRGTDATFYNSIIAGGDADTGIDFRDDSVEATPEFFSTYVVDFATTATATTVSSGVFPGPAGNNNVDGSAQDSTLTVGSNGTVALVPGANENAVTPTTVPGSFFDAADYIGAVENDADNWYLGWTIAL